MRNYILRRLGQAVLVLLAAYTLSFALLSALPGDSVNNRINDPDALYTPEAAHTLIEFYGLDQPLWRQYLSGIGHALSGDLGYSLSKAIPVTELIADALPKTLALTGLALAFGLVFAVLIAVAGNYARWGWLRGAAASLPALFASVPTFVVGILALQFLSFRLRLIPSVDDGSFTALVAPAVTLGILITAPLAQVLTTSIQKTRQLPFVHVLHAKGAGEGFIFRKDVLRNSSLPVLTLLGLACGELIAGSVVTEAVFARSGIGQLTVGAVATQDLPIVQGVVLVAALAYVVVNLIVDFAYPFIDPRILLDGKVQRVTRVKRTVAAAVPPKRVMPEPGRRGLPADVVMP